jgi:hypothetical protein
MWYFNVLNAFSVLTVGRNDPLPIPGIATSQLFTVFRFFLEHSSMKKTRHDILKQVLTVVIIDYVAVPNTAQ